MMDSNYYVTAVVSKVLPVHH